MTSSWMCHTRLKLLCDGKKSLYISSVILTYVLQNTLVELYLLRINYWVRSLITYGNNISWQFIGPNISSQRSNLIEMTF